MLPMNSPRISIHMQLQPKSLYHEAYQPLEILINIHTTRTNLCPSPLPVAQIIYNTSIQFGPSLDAVDRVANCARTSCMYYLTHLGQRTRK